MEPKFTITLVQSVIKNRPYAKIDGSYSGPTWKNNIGLESIPNTLEGVLAVMQKLLVTPAVCMVYGTAIRPRIPGTDRTLKNFTEEPISLLTLDMDGYASPNMGHFGKDITYKQAIEDVDFFINKHLPPEFHDTGYVVRFSSSFLIKDTKLRCHLMFLLEEPQYPREVGAWIKLDKIPADSTFYTNLTQPVFTSGPVWVNMVDPLSLKDGYFPRVSMVKKFKSHVAGGWQPYTVPKRGGEVKLEDLPKAEELPGKVGSFCRMSSIDKVLEMLGYEHHGEGRYLSPTSSTKLPGAMVFPNGYVFSHHNNDPINQVCDGVYKGKRRSLNAYDLMYGWAILKKDEDPKLMGEFNFMLRQAILEDTRYQDEILNEYILRTDWLEENGYVGINKNIIDSIVLDVTDEYLTNMSKDYLSRTIVAKTGKHVKKSDVDRAFSKAQKDRAVEKDDFDPEAGLRHMASIFSRANVLYSYHYTLGGDFWCYYKEVRMWKLLNRHQTEGFIYKYVHASLPVKTEIQIQKAEQLIRLIMKLSCEQAKKFRPGQGWAFKGGKQGLSMTDMFKDTWTVDGAVKTLTKTDRIIKELPFTYEEWQASKGKIPTKFIDFLISSCEEDYEKVELIREFLGYVYSDSYAIHKFLIIEGVPGSGKSILSKVMRACLGRDFYSAVSLARLTTQFGLSDLPGKKLAVLSEAREIDFNVLRGAVPILLKLIGHDPIDVEVKMKTSKTEMLDCKLLVLTNRTPILPDDTGALAQRILFLRLNKTFRGTKQEILGLDDIIVEAEIPRIVRWLMGGLESLSKRKEFIEPESSKKEKQGLLEQIDPLKNFIEQYFVIKEHSDKSKYIESSQLTFLFQAYLFRIGQRVSKEKILKRISIRNLKSLFPQLDRLRVREGDKLVWRIERLIPTHDLALEFVSEMVEAQEANLT